MPIKLTDVASEAGVSSATADRVINGRTGVSPHTRERVLAAARKLKYGIRERSGSRGGARIGFLIQAGANAFIKELIKRLKTTTNLSAARSDVEVIEDFEPSQFTTRLRSLSRECDGIGVVAQDHPMIRAAINEVSDTGVPIVVMVSDISQVSKVAYVGIENRSAGRAAGQLIGLLLGREKQLNVGLVGGSLSFRGGLEREIGFKSLMHEEYPNLTVIEAQRLGQDADENYETAHQAFSRYDIAAVYNVGPGTGALCRAAEDVYERCPPFVVHDLTRTHVKLLNTGQVAAVLEQNPLEEAERAIALLANAVAGNASRIEPPFSRINIVLRETVRPEDVFSF